MPTTIEPPAPLPPRAAARPVIVLVLVLVVVAAFWRFGPLSGLANPHRLADLASKLRAHPQATILALGAYLMAALTFFPMTWLLAATALVFEPLRALGLGLLGALAAAALTYGMGRVVARHRPAWLETPRLARLRERLRQRGVLTMVGMRLVPVGNFSLINIAAGAMGIPFRAYMLGNLLGLLPSLLLLTLFADRVRALGWGAP